jgi:hypothetical protein
MRWDAEWEESYAQLFVRMYNILATSSSYDMHSLFHSPQHSYIKFYWFFHFFFFFCACKTFKVNSVNKIKFLGRRKKISVRVKSFLIEVNCNSLVFQEYNFSRKWLWFSWSFYYDRELLTYLLDKFILIFTNSFSRGHEK